LSEEDSTWISWFCALKGNEFFCEVDEGYIQDEFNLTGLATMVPYYDYALDTILDIDTALDSLSEEQQEMVDSAAELLYGLIHARFILTARGLNAMAAKYEDVTFGRCHRVYCEGQPMLPVGRSDTPRKYGVTLYCPRCNDVYYPKSRRHGKIDGAYFGTTFPHLFLLTFAQLVPGPPTDTYAPRIFGFRIYTGLDRDGKPVIRDVARAAARAAAAATAGQAGAAAAGEVGYQAAAAAEDAVVDGLGTHGPGTARAAGHIAHLAALEDVVGAETAASKAGPPVSLPEALRLARDCSTGVRIGAASTAATSGAGGVADALAPAADAAAVLIGNEMVRPGLDMHLIMRAAARGAAGAGRPADDGAGDVPAAGDE